MSDPVRRSLCEAVEGSILMGHMRELARWVKLSGTPDELQSLRYFQARLDEYGYRTKLIMHDAYISLPGKARVDVGQPDPDQHHALLLPQFATGRRDRTAGLCGRRRRGRFRRSRPAGCDRADRRHRQPRPGRARLAGRRGRARCRSARTSICTRCASRRSGAARRTRRRPTCRRPWSAPCRTRTAARCANAWRAASNPRSRCMPRSTPAGAARRFSWPRSTGPTRTVRSSCSPAIMTPGTTA